jgi:hypothetical protein
MFFSEDFWIAALTAMLMQQHCCMHTAATCSHALHMHVAFMRSSRSAVRRALHG